MIAPQKEGKWNEETWDWVRVWATVTIEQVEGMAKLRHQIAQLRAALT